MTADELDTAALRARGPYITSMASDGYPVICVDTDSWNAMCDEIDRLRADLEIARELVAHWQRLYLEADRERVELSAGAASGVQPAPTLEVCACGHDEAAHKDDRGEWTCCHPMWRCGCLAYWGGRPSAAGSTDQPPSSVANDWCVPCMAWHPKGIDCSG